MNATNVSCLYCGEPLASQRKFCTPACSNRFRCVNKSLCDCRTPEAAGQKLWHRLATKTEAGCWELAWAKRYATIHYLGTPWLAHRLSLYLATGKHPGRFLVMHSCDNPKCVNPAHLSPGTTQDNSDDMVAKGRSCRGRRRPGTGPAGERNCKAKITREVADSIRAEYAAGGLTIRELARRRRLSKSQVHNIVTNSQWKAVA